jgi:hypothetical protein
MLAEKIPLASNGKNLGENRHLTFAVSFRYTIVKVVKNYSLICKVARIIVAVQVMDLNNNSGNYQPPK